MAEHPPGRKRTSIEGQIEEIDYELEDRAERYQRLAGRDPRKQAELQMHVERAKDIKATLEFCRDNKAAIVEVSARIKNLPDDGVDHDLATRPRRVRENDESFAVHAANGCELAYIYFEDEPTRRNSMKRLTKAAARMLAYQIAALP